MAKPEKKAPERMGSASYFLRCFGFSRKIYTQKPMTASPEGPKKKKKQKDKKKTRWFSWSKFRLMNGEIKLATVDLTMEKSKSNSNDQSDNKQKKLLPAIIRVTDRKNIPVDHKAATRQEIPETKTNEQEDLIRDNPKPYDPLSSSKDDTCHKRVFSTLRGKPDPITTGKSGLTPTGHRTWQQRSPTDGATEDPDKPGRVKSGRLQQRNGSSSGGKFDPIVGLSIVLLTLVIMLIWGRLCAILCTSAWCYFLSRVRNVAAVAATKRDHGTAESGSDPGDPDLYSESYKRKVVLEGFLERKNRVSL